MVGRIVVKQLGGPEVLEWAEAELEEPGPGEVRVRHTAVGVNFIDVYYRTGLYMGPKAPFTLGMEACGVVEAVGLDVANVHVGDRVAYASGPLGSYSEARLMVAARLVSVPKEIDDRTAAAMMLKGMTAEYLLHRTVSIRAGDAILVHAAAGGVGIILCQWAKALGATVIGTVGTEEKAALAREHGCDHVILSTQENIAARVRALTGGAGVRVVYDSVGKDTLHASLDSLSPRGVFVLYGQSSGKVEPFDPQLLNQKGSLFMTRPSLVHYVATRLELVESAARLFDAVRVGAVKIRIGQTYALKDARQAHEDLEGRRTTGSSVMVV